MPESEMCTCIEDLYWAEIRVPLGPAVLLGVGALLVYRLWKFVAAVVEDCDDESGVSGSDDESVMSGSEDEYSGYGDEADDDYCEDDDCEDDCEDEADEAGEADDEEDDGDAVTSDPEDALFDPSAEDPDVEYPYSAGLTVTPWGLSVPNAAANPEIFPEDDTVYEVSLIDAPTPGPALVAPDVISSTEEASSDTALPLPEIGGTLSGSSPPDTV